MEGARVAGERRATLRAPGERRATLRAPGEGRATLRAPATASELAASETPVAFLSLGSNVGDRLANLRAARAALAAGGLTIIGSSSVYETEPQGEVLDQPDFLNACVAVTGETDPERLLDRCKAVEGEVGRRPGGPRHGPRPIDVDVLLLGGVEWRSDRLTIPHRDVTSRRFVLVPLLELEPRLQLPDGTPLAEALARLTGQRVTRVAAL